MKSELHSKRMYRVVIWQKYSEVLKVNVAFDWVLAFFSKMLSGISEKGGSDVVQIKLSRSSCLTKYERVDLRINLYVQCPIADAR